MNGMTSTRDTPSTDVQANNLESLDDNIRGLNDKLKKDLKDIVRAKGQIAKAQLRESDGKRFAVIKAWKLGKLLQERKEATPHKEWLPYLESLGIQERSAQKYMRIGNEIRTESDLGKSLNATLQKLGPARSPARPDQVTIEGKAEPSEQAKRQKEGARILSQSNRKALELDEQPVEEDDTLPDTIEACHAMIRELRAKLAELAKRKK